MPVPEPEPSLSVGGVLAGVRKPRRAPVPTADPAGTTTAVTSPAGAIPAGGGQVVGLCEALGHHLRSAVRLSSGFMRRVIIGCLRNLSATAPG